MADIFVFLSPFGSTGFSTRRRKHLRECRKMCLHVEELPCEGLGRVAHHIDSLPALDDLAAQEYTHLLLLVLPHNGVRCGGSTVFLDHHLGGDG
jgi:hypothetical protein